MATLLAAELGTKGVDAVWTTSQFCAAIAPHLFGTLANPAIDLAPLTRRAHVVAVASGLAWNPAGRYPISVWNVVFA
jgi:short-subunit dehydrogenase involved in D-alanine esterification of teichoic acids